MLTGVQLNAQAAGNRGVVAAPFDPRPWPLVVLMLAGLVGVFVALKPGGGNGSGGKAPDIQKVEEGAESRARVARGSAVIVPVLGEVKESIEQGVTLSFSQDGKTDVRPARVMSLYVPEKQAPSPFLKPGAFTATWSGFLNLRLRGEFTFSMLGRGKVAINVGGKKVLEADGDDFAGKSSALIKMEKGKNPIEVVYASPAKGDAWVRVLWTSREFSPEPVQPTVLSHDAGNKALREAGRLREGRELLGNLRCVNCHAMPAPGVGAMPELAADAPDLSKAGARLKQGWMAAWIADPKKLRADASMPRVFHSAGAAEAGDLAAYLATLSKPAAAEEAKEFEDEAVTQGGQLFAGLGCVGCHTKPDADEADKSGARVPLKFVNAKFRAGGLKAWLMNPQEHYQWTRMPNFHLSEFEADRLVAYLGKNAKGEVAGNEKGDAAKGRALFAAVGCVNCHKVKEGNAPQAEPLKAGAMDALLASSDWAKGCLAGDDAARGKAPDFALVDGQRGALRAIAAAGLASLANDVGPEFAERTIRQSQCTACHARDEVEDRWSTVADEVGELMPPEGNVEGDQNEEAAKGPRLFVPRGLGKGHVGDQIVISGDQARPALTWTGEKLRPAWMTKMIAGTVEYKLRYWLRARMPGFPVRGAGLAAGLAMEHGFPPVDAPPPAAADADLAAAGLKLVGRDGGFACVTCHSIVDVKAISPFEAPAPNFAHVADRMTHDYYLRWMRKPMRFQPGTKMPQFSEDGKSTLKEILDGDADKQFEAIWQYLLQGPKMAPPE